MEKYAVFPDSPLTKNGICTKFRSLGINSFIDACRYTHCLPYGYNSDRDDLMILFKENMGTCTTKHSVIATLAKELGLPVTKTVGIYPMTEEIVSGTNKILTRYALPYVPMLHCFLEHGEHRVDLTEGNANGKNRSIEHFLFTKTVEPNLSAKDEYLLYRQALKDSILKRAELQKVNIKQILHAREEGLVLLKSKIEPPAAR